MTQLGVQFVGGPTAILEYGGLWWLTAPTLSPPGEYGGLTKLTAPRSTSQNRTRSSQASARIGSSNAVSGQTGIILIEPLSPSLPSTKLTSPANKLRPLSASLAICDMSATTEPRSYRGPT